MAVRIDGTNTAANPGITGADADTGLQFGTDEVKIVTGGTEKVKVDSSGKVGIGTSAPSNPIHVTNSSSSVATAYFNNTSTGGDSPSLIVQGGANNAGTVGTFEVRDYNGNTDFKVQGDGKVGIGTSSPTYGLQVEHGTDVAKFYHTSTLNTTAIIFRHSRGLSGFQGKMVSMQRNDGTEVGNIIIGVASTAFNTSSDYRLKENVVDITDGITRIKQLSPKRFNFIVDDTTTVDGFIAHEAQTVVPEAVTGEKDATKEEEYEVTPAVVNDDGKEVTPAVMGTRTVPDHQGIDQSKLVPLLTAALQEAITKIETLETQNASLEARLTALEGGAS